MDPLPATFYGNGDHLRTVGGRSIKITRLPLTRTAARLPAASPPSIRTYHYNGTVTPPDDPTKEEDDDYTYEFTGWNPDIVMVTENCTYKATWQATLKAGLEATGIIVSDGINSEDINCNGALVSGYTCELADYSIPGGTVQVPELTIEDERAHVQREQQLCRVHSHRFRLRQRKL